MPPPLLILINGAPCTGKTTIGRVLARELSLPYFSKDGFKEILFEALGWGDKHRSQRLGQASYELLYYAIEQEIQSGHSLVAEANFHADRAGPRIRRIMEEHALTLVQILCCTERAVLLERYKRRVASSERHPGHLDALLFDEFERRVHAREWEALQVEGTLLRLDTTNLDKIDFVSLIELIRTTSDGTETKTQKEQRDDIS